jgi:N-hydroxyarylamine O-acetyltransferase
MTTTHWLDVDSYFARIGYAGSRQVSLATLNAIVDRHVQSIPFENIAILLGQPISIEVGAIEEKLVHRRRGGYCFEQNTLLLHVLEALGFSVSALSARTRYRRPERYGLPRTHMLLRVELDGESYLADVGLGGFSPACALRLVVDQAQDTPHEPRRLVREGSWLDLTLHAPDAVLLHQAYFGAAWHTLAELTLEHMPPMDREMANWYTSAHPGSHFREHLIAARVTPNGRVTLQDDELTLRPRAGVAETRVLSTYDELLGALEEHFTLSFPPETRFVCPGLARLDASSPSRGR